jgi:hypothetical protein
MQTLGFRGAPDDERTLESAIDSSARVGATCTAASECEPLCCYAGVCPYRMR